MGADGPHQALGDDEHNGRRYQVALDALVHHPGDGAGRVVGVDRREHQVAGEGRPDGDLRRLQVPDLTNHHDVGVLAQERAQARGEGEPLLLVDLHLADAADGVFDRVLDGEDVLLGRVDLRHGGVERGGLSRAGGPGDQDDAVVVVQVLPDHLEVLLLEPDLVEAVQLGGLVEQSHDDPLTGAGGDRADPDVDLSVADAQRGAAVLGEAALRDVHLAHDLDAADDRVLDALGDRVHVIEDAVDPEAHLHPVGVGLEVDVRGAELERLEQDGVHQLDDRRLVGDVEHVLRVVDLRREGADVSVLGDGVQGLVHAVRLVAIGAGDQRRDLLPRREDRVHLAADHGREIVHGVGVQGRAGCDLQDAVARLEGDEVVVPREVDRNGVHEGPGDLRPVEALAELVAEVLGVDLEEGALLHEVLGEDDPIDGVARDRGDPAAFLELVPGESRVQEQFSDADHGVVGRERAQSSGVSSSSMRAASRGDSPTWSPAVSPRWGGV